MHHHLKTWPQWFQRMKSGEKNFEVRVNDRGYQAGDLVTLHEWVPDDPQGYTGQDLHFKIGYVFPIDDTRVVFSLVAP